MSKITIKKLQNVTEYKAAQETCMDFMKIHGNILSCTTGELLIDFPDAINMAHPAEPNIYSRLSEYQLQMIFDAGNLFRINLNVALIYNPATC